MKAEIGRLYALIQNGVVCQIFTSAEMPEWHDGLDVRDVTDLPGVALGWIDAGVIVQPPAPPSPEAMVAEKASILKQARGLRGEVLNRLTGIQVNTADAQTIVAIKAARQALLDITDDAGVVEAVTGAETKAAIMARWHAIAATLAADAPSVVSVFVGMGME